MSSIKDKTDDLSNQPVELKKLVEYQPDTVVSREIISKPTGTVTLFAFDQGQGLSEHTTPFNALVYIIDGKAEITIAGKIHNLTSRRKAHGGTINPDPQHGNDPQTQGVCRAESEQA